MHGYSQLVWLQLNWVNCKEKSLSFFLFYSLFSFFIFTIFPWSIMSTISLQNFAFANNFIKSCPPTFYLYHIPSKISLQIFNSTYNQQRSPIYPMKPQLFLQKTQFLIFPPFHVMDNHLFINNKTNAQMSSNCKLLYWRGK